MLRRLGLVLFLVTSLGLVTTRAWAANPHFIASQTDASVNPTTGALTVDYKASGYGSGETVLVSLSASSSSLTLGCINKGSNEPQGLRTFVGPVQATDSVTAGRTGTVSGTISALPAGAASFSCPSHNMRVTLISATYSGVVISAGGASLNLGTVSYP